MNAALYIRVSTEEQVDYSPESQRRLLLDYAKKNQLTVLEEHIFIDGGISGRKADKRPQFQKMIALARSKERPFEKILVWKFSRFARNQEESIVYKNMLRKDNIDVVSISEPIIDGPFGSLIERIIEWMDEYYSTRLSGEVHRGMSEKASTVGILATPPYGYKLINGNYVIDTTESEIIRFIFKNVIDGKGTSTICRELLNMGVKSRRGSPWIPKRVKYCIQNPVYCGKLRWNYSTHKGGRKINDESDWIITDGTHEPIITEDEFKCANEVLSRLAPLTTKRPSKYEIRHYLSGLLRCCDCNATLVYSKRPRQNKKGISYQMYYRCNNFQKGACKTSNHIKLSTIETKVICLLEKDLSKIKDKGSVENIVKKSTADDEKSILEKQLEKIKNKYDMAKRAYLAEIDSLEEYKATKKNIQEEEQSILNKLHSLTTVDVQEDNKKIGNFIENSLAILQDDSKTMKEKNDFLKQFISKIKIDVKKSTLDIYYFL